MNKWYTGYIWAAFGLVLPGIAKLNTAPTALDGVFFYVVGVAVWGSFISAIIFAWNHFRNKNNQNIDVEKQTKIILPPQNNSITENSVIRSKVDSAKKISQIHLINKSQISTNIDASNDMDEDHVYEAIAQEIEDGLQNKGLWTRLFCECDGDENKTRAAYIKQRVEKILGKRRFIRRICQPSQWVKRYRQVANNAQPR